MTSLHISGSAGDDESAAIAAVVAHVLAREAEIVATPPRGHGQSDWVMAWRPSARPLRSQQAPSPKKDSNAGEAP
jgi:hypothetical protein